jgi:hypothetical protein
MKSAKEIADQINQKCVQKLKQFMEESQSFAYFLGSGISSHYCPTWEHLPLEFENIFRQNGWNWNNNLVVDPATLKDFEAKDFQNIFQQIADNDPQHFIEAIEVIFEKTPPSHKDYLLNIVRTKPELVVTLNFDISIQSAFERTEYCNDYCVRLFPHDLQVHPDPNKESVIMHMHGKWHNELASNPEWIVLHKDGYDFAYNAGIKPIRNLLKNIFVPNDIIFIGTSLIEPEMRQFLTALTNREEQGGSKKLRLAFLKSEALNNIQNEKEILSSFEEQALERYSIEAEEDSIRFTKLGIECIRYIPVNGDHKGLNDIISDALGYRRKPKNQDISW